MARFVAACLSRGVWRVIRRAFRGPSRPSWSWNVSPLFAELAGLPPLLVHAGEVEVLVDQVRAFCERASSAGVEVELEVYEDMVHVWHMLLAFTPRAQEGIDAIARFIAAKAASA